MPILNVFTDLMRNITSTAGNTQRDEIDALSNTFNDALSKALNKYNSEIFDDNGFIKNLSTLRLSSDPEKDKELMKNILNTMIDYINVDTLNQSELLLRRDIFNVCQQMPEMHDLIQIVRDAIVECNVSSGEVSRSITFEYHDQNEEYENQTKDLEKKFKLLTAIKNFIVPRALMHGETYVQIIPYSKLFAELDQLNNLNVKNKINNKNYGTRNFNTLLHENVIYENIPNDMKAVSLNTKENLKILTEAVSPISMVNTSNDNVIANNETSNKNDKLEMTKLGLETLLSKIEVYNSSSTLLSEVGPEAFREYLAFEYEHYNPNIKDSKLNSYTEDVLNTFNNGPSGFYKNMDQHDVDTSQFNDIKGCYIKYLDGLRMIPIRIDRRIAGYYYVTTTMDLQTNPANPNGIIDLSFQNYIEDKNVLDKLAVMIIRSFDKKMLLNNIKLKKEIAEIVMAHRFSEGKLSFIYIPESEVVRFAVNEDDFGKGHSIVEPTLFPARLYLMLMMYNMLYTLNNNATRIHYVRSSGLDKDYSSVVQTTMRLYESRRINMDDIFSYSGVLNKIGGMGEMVLPAGKGDVKAIETDTLEAAPNPINTEFLDMLRKMAITGTGVPHLLITEGIQNAEFAKTLELANTRFLSTVSSYKIDFNEGITNMYQKLLSYCTDIKEDVIKSLRFQFNQPKQQYLSITYEMIQSFNALVELIASMKFTAKDLKDDGGNDTPLAVHLKNEVAKEYLPQIEFDMLDRILKKVNLDYPKDLLQDKVKQSNITNEDIDKLKNKK